jgi:hypothetical protein
MEKWGRWYQVLENAEAAKDAKEHAKRNKVEIEAARR